MKYCILNFVHGHGPFLRTTELALLVNEILEIKGQERLGIIVPWVYGEKQKKIMEEQFNKILNEHQDEIILDKNLGAYIGELFYSGEQTYSESLGYFLQRYTEVQKSINEYLHVGINGETFSGKKVFIEKKDISFGISRAPRLALDIKPSYYTGFAYMSDILKNAVLESAETGLEADLLKKSIHLFESIEEQHNLHFIAEPGTFSYNRDIATKRQTEIPTPPSIAIPVEIDYKDVEKGLYVTVSGIPGLEKLYKNLYQDISKLGYTVYTNKPDEFTKSKKFVPGILKSKNILFHFARSGWGSSWLSLFTKTPFITPKFSLKDDPEVYFNNICLEKIGLGMIYDSQSLSELEDFSNKYKKRAEIVCQELLEKFGTIDGAKYTAEKIVEHFLKYKK